MNILNIGIIGAGGIAESHANAICSMNNVKISVVADIDLQRGKYFEMKYGAKPYVDYRKMIEQSKLDAVVINLPHGLHREAAVFCANHGLHILLEKPMANTMEECNEIMAAAKHGQVKLMIGHIQRYFAENKKAKEIIQSGEYGEIVSITDVRNIEYFTDVRPKWFFSKSMAGGGILMNYGAHSLDKIMWITGMDIKSISGKIAQHLPGYEVEGDAQIYVKLQNDIAVQISYCGYKTPYLNETCFYMTRGVIKLCTGAGVWASNGDAWKEIPTCNHEDAFALMWKDFIDSIEQDTVPEVSGEWGQKIIKEIESVYIDNSKYKAGMI